MTSTVGKLAKQIGAYYINSGDYNNNTLRTTLSKTLQAIDYSHRYLFAVQALEQMTITNEAHF